MHEDYNVVRMRIPVERNVSSQDIIYLTTETFLILNVTIWHYTYLLRELPSLWTDKIEKQTATLVILLNDENRYTLLSRFSHVK